MSKIKGTVSGMPASLAAKRAFCITTMEVLDEWCEDNGFEISGYMAAEFSNNLWDNINDLGET